MSLPAGFTLDGARRIGEATRAYEAGLLGQGGFTNRAPGGPGLMLAKTPSSLPGGYNGSTALEGTLVELPQGSTSYHTTISAIWIQALNDEALSASTVYHARFAGTLTQSGTTLPYFLVDAAGGGSTAWTPGTFCFLRYNGGGYTGTGSSAYTTCQYAAPSGGSISWTNISVKNGSYGPLFHAATNASFTTYSAVSSIGTPTFFGVTGTSGGSVDDRCIPTLVFPAYFQVPTNVSGFPKQVQFQIKAGAITSTWYFCTYDPINWGSVGRLSVFNWTDVTTSGGNVTSVLDNTRTQFHQFNEPSIFGQTGTYFHGLVAYSLNTGWCVANVAGGVTAAGEIIYFQRLGY